MVSTGRPSDFVAYIAAKAAIVGLTRALAREVGADGICVNAIAPGLVPMDKIGAGGERATALRDFAVEVRSQQAIPLTAVPADICGLVKFPASSRPRIAGRVERSGCTAC
jgi:3-oxoacyl-[acyl-carrier protein] reductase